MADFRDHYDAIRTAGYDVAALSVDPPRATALLQAELFLPFDMLRDPDRSVLQAWDLLNTEEKDGIPIPAVFAIGAGRMVLGRSIDTMVRQVHPQAFLDSIDQASGTAAPRHLLLPRILEFLKANIRITRDARRSQGA